MKLNTSVLFSSICLVTAGMSFSYPTFALKETPTAASVLTQSTKNQPLDEADINRFTSAISEIKDFYVQSISDKKLLEDAIRGMLSGLDPHSEYLDEDSYKTLLMTTNGEFGGLGIEVTGEYGVLKVISPIDDTPASRAGIKAGDYIVAIDGKLVNEMTLQEAVDSMRGKKGSQVSLTVIRKGDKAPINFKLQRDTIRIVSVKSKMLDNGFGYVRITQFQEPTTELMISAIEKLKQAAGGKLSGLVLDLRNNPGGLLETAVQIADVFLNPANLNNKYNNVIVYTEGRLQKAQYSAKITPKTTHGDILDGAPIVILVNEGSASASEIVAGALQDYRRAIILGTQSFGKGSVQTVLPLDDKHAIKLTTALYHTPSGRIIQNIGVIPDILVADLKVDSKIAPDTTLEPIKEFELKGHLMGAAADKASPTSNINKTDSIALAKEDFQLYEAQKVLKTIYMLGGNSNVFTTTAVVTPAVTAAQK